MMSSDSSENAASDSTAVDVADEEVGGLYAKALIEAAQNADQVEPLLAELDSFVTDVLDQLPDFESILVSDMIAHEDRVDMLRRAIGDQASPLMFNFLAVVCRNHRVSSLRAIRRCAHRIYDTMQGRVRVQLTSASPLDESLAGRIAEQLHTAIGAEPILERKVDPDLIGGLVVRIGDTVYDGSVRAQLDEIKNQMIHRSVHEIQSRRDRFSSPSGN